jgi:CRP-like cAMP-binding protein
MRAVADLANGVPMAAGTPLFAESAPPALWLILSGEVQLEGGAGHERRSVRGGDTIGALQMMAGIPLGVTATVVAGGVALRLNRADLFDLLGERPELLRQMFAGIFRMREAVQPVTA